MKLKGIDKLREKLPAYPGKRIGLLILGGALVSLAGYLFLVLLDVLPRFFIGVEFLFIIEPFLPLLGSLLIMALALTFIGQVWSARGRMKARFGELAYQKMLPVGLTGVFLVPPIVFHQFTSIRSLPPSPPVNNLTIAWSQSVLPIIGVAPEVDVLLRLVLSGVFLLFGILTVRSAVFTFGVDYMAVVYLYFPEESEIQEFEIYSVVRHPAYLGGVLLGVSGLFFRFSVYSILLFIVVYAMFGLQARREERELVERFGESYKEYMDRVPRLHIRPENIRPYLRFLRGSI